MTAILTIGGDPSGAVDAFGAVGGASRAAGTTVKSAGRDANAALASVVQSARDTEKGMADAAKKAAGFGLAVVGIGSAVKAGQMAFRALSGAIKEYIDSNEAATETVDKLKGELGALRASIGGAVVGGGNLQRIAQVLSDAMAEVKDAIEANHDAIQEFTREGLARLVEGLGAASTAFVRFQQIVVLTEQAFANIKRANVIGIVRNTFGDLSDDIGETHDRLLELDSRVARMAPTFDRWAAAIRAPIGPLDRLRAALSQINDLWRTNRTVVEDATRATNTNTEALTKQEQVLQQVIAAKQTQQALAEWFAAEDAAEIERLTAKFNLQSELQRKEDEQILASVMMEKEAREAAHEAMLAMIDEETAARERAIQDEIALQQKREKATHAAISSIAGGAARLAQAEKQHGEVIKDVIGQEMQARGMMIMLTAAAKFFNPATALIGALEFAAGGALFAAGVGLSKSAASAMAPPSTPAPTAEARGNAAPMQQGAQSTTNTTVVSNFGIVGDEREAARLVADSVRVANREGYL